MWRAVSLAIGLSMVFLGLQCLFVDQFLIKNLQFELGLAQPGSVESYSNPYQTVGFPTYNYQAARQNNGPQYRLVQTKEWMPWSLLAAGTVIVIYTFSLRNRGLVAKEAKPQA